MPRGRPAKQATAPVIEYDRLVRSMQNTIDEELNEKGSEARAKLLASFDEDLATVQALANGVKVLRPVGRGGVVCLHCGAPAEEIVYTVPPLWSALRWLMDWQRQLIKEEPKRSVEHKIDPASMEAMRTYIEERNHLALTSPILNPDGVINLSDEPTPEADSPAYNPKELDTFYDDDGDIGFGSADD